MKKKKKSEAVEWYIKGEYHCDKCPFCWGGEYLPGCDDYEDAGCYIFGDLRDTCRLIPPIRFVLGWGKRKKMQYIENHRYDDYGKWIDKEIADEDAFLKAFQETFAEKYAICFKDGNGDVETFGGKPYILDENGYLGAVTELFHRAYEILSTPQPYEPLRKKWMTLIKETWHRFIGVFKPYFCE